MRAWIAFVLELQRMLAQIHQELLMRRLRQWEVIMIEEYKMTSIHQEYATQIKGKTNFQIAPCVYDQ